METKNTHQQTFPPVTMQRELIFKNNPNFNFNRYNTCLYNLTFTSFKAGADHNLMQNYLFPYLNQDRLIQFK